VLAEVILGFLEDEYFNWCAREAANADLFELIIFVEGLGVFEGPPAALEQLLNNIIIPVFTHLAVASCENDVSAFLD